MNAKHFTSHYNSILPHKKSFDEILFGQGKYFKSEGFYPIPNCWMHSYLTVSETKYLRAQQQRMPPPKNV